MKTKEELNALKEEVEALNKKLSELTEEELAQVSGGDTPVRNITSEWKHFAPLTDDICGSHPSPVIQDKPAF